MLSFLYCLLKFHNSTPNSKVSYFRPTKIFCNSQEHVQFFPNFTHLIFESNSQVVLSLPPLLTHLSITTFFSQLSHSSRIGAIGISEVEMILNNLPHSLTFLKILPFTSPQTSNYVISNLPPQLTSLLILQSRVTFIPASPFLLLSLLYNWVDHPLQSSSSHK